MYTVQQSQTGKGYDVVRSAPAVVAADLKLPEAEALAFALNAQITQLEGRR